MLTKSLRNSKTASKNPQEIEMKNLEFLEINIVDMIFLLNKGFVKFSSTKLKVLKLDGNYAGKGRNFIRNFIAQQKNLKVLHLDGYFDYVFDQTVKFDYIQLKEISLHAVNGQTDDEQNNFAEFLESQKKLEEVRYRQLQLKFRNNITPRLLKCQMNLLNLPSISLKFEVMDDAQIFLWLYDFRNYPSSDLLQCSHQKNLVTEDLDVTIFATENIQSVLNSLCTKFPNLKILRLKISRCNKIHFDFQPLGTLENLESFFLTLNQPYLLDTSVLSGVTIPKLKSFAFVIGHSICRSKKISVNPDNLKNFLALHKKIEYFKLESMSGDEKGLAKVIGFHPVLKYAMEILPELTTVHMIFDYTQATRSELSDFSSFWNLYKIKKVANPEFSIRKLVSNQLRNPALFKLILRQNSLREP